MIVAHKSAPPTIKRGGLVVHAGTISSARMLPGLSGLGYCRHNMISVSTAIRIVRGQMLLLKRETPEGL